MRNWIHFFFYEGFLSRTLTPHKIAGEGRGPFFIPPYHSHPLANIQTFIYNFCMWDDYHMFLILPLVFTRLLLKEIYHLSNYHLIDWWCDIDCCWFCYSYLTWETGGLEFALTIILVLQANRLINSAFSQNQGTFFQFSRKGSKDLPQLLPLDTCL